MSLGIWFVVNQQVVVKDFSHSPRYMIAGEYFVHLDELWLDAKDVC